MKTLTLISLLTLIVATFSLNACNTVEGVGQDLQKGGRALQDAAR